jgi:lipid-A-disaccharide synthase
MLSCGEPSGDLYAGALTRELRRLDPTVTVSGLGGPEFSAAGGELIADYRRLTATGLIEPIGKVPQSFATLGRLGRFARTARPEALVVIDFAGFNFRLARRIKRLGIPIIYYISPQIWAWRAWRLKTIREIADLVLVIFPFEEKIYREAGVPVRFVGHPLIDLAASADKATFLRRCGLSATAPTVAILPGSRSSEVRRILPDLLAAAARIRAAVPAVQFIVARAPGLADYWFNGVGNRAASVEGKTDAVLSSADVALTASGTATVQCALHDTPMVIVYRVSSLEYFVGRRMVTLDTFGMVNLIAGEKIVPELIQDAFTPDAVAREAIAMLTDRARHARIREGLARVRERLGGPGASRRAAEAILGVINASTSRL